MPYSALALLPLMTDGQRSPRRYDQSRRGPAKPPWGDALAMAGRIQWPGR